MSSSGRIRHLLFVVATALVFVLPGSPASTQSRAVPPVEYTAVAWNMQGSSASTENKWPTYVQPLAASTGERGIVALQEAGEPPSSAHELLPPRRITDQVGDDWAVRSFTWGRDSQRRPFQVFWLDTGRQRVSLALVVSSSLRVVRIRVVASLAAPHLRPALGVEVGDGPEGSPDNTTFYTVHAASGGGFNAEDLALQVECETTTRWEMLGDFNRAPDARPGQSTPWLGPRTGVICPPDRATHPATRPVSRLDYAVRGPATLTPPAVTGRVLPDFQGSDHLPVRFAFGGGGSG
jgi:cytolethal distending toxin subunit B